MHDGDNMKRRALDALGDTPLILASGSPRRAKILADMGLPFDVVKSEAPELAYPSNPEQTVTENALAKGAAVAALPVAKGRHVISADTIVWMDGKIFGKPADAGEARQFLRELSGRTHRVYTGVAIDGKAKTYVSEVTFRELSDATIDEYIRLVNPIDRAGAYDIDEHGDMIISRWTGSYENIMGLPKESLQFGVGCLQPQKPQTANCKQRTLLHVCCGPCASSCIPRLKDAGCAVTMYYSNSNIDTYEEFERRRNAAETLASADGIDLICDKYNHADWLEKVARGYENEPEKGRRCERCFRYNLERAAKYAAEHGFDNFTTSLTVSPHKPSAVVFAASDDPHFLKMDFKKRDGFKLSVARAAELGLYRQSYCGCEFSRRSG